jgi:hypothetical protein
MASHWSSVEDVAAAALAVRRAEHDGTAHEERMELRANLDEQVDRLPPHLRKLLAEYHRMRLYRQGRRSA